MITTMDFSIFTTHLQTVYKDLFQKLDIYEWQDVFELAYEHCPHDVNHAYDEGYDEGYGDGYQNGSDIGHEMGLDEGYDNGYQNGREEVLDQLRRLTDGV